MEEPPGIGERKRFFEVPETDKPVKIFVEDDKSTKCIEVSRQLLARNSPEFKRRLIEDKRPPPMNETLRVNDVTFNLLQHMINFVKTEKIPDDLILDEMINLLISAQRYEMQGLVFQCECDLMKRVTMKNVCRLYEISKKVPNKTLRRWCLAFLRREIVGLSEGIADLSSSSLKELLSLNRLNVTNESVVLQKVLLWARTKRLDLSHGDVGLLLDCVRWKFLTPDETSQFDPDDLAYYQSLADESKSSRDSSRGCGNLNESIVSGKDTTESYSPASRSKEYNGSPTEKNMASRRRSKGSEIEECVSNYDESIYFDRDVFKRINASGRRHGTAQETENMYLQIYRNGRWQGSGRQLRKRSSCTSQDRLFLFTSGDKNYPRTTFNDVLPSVNFSENQDFQIEVPQTLERKYVTTQNQNVLCLTFTVLRRLHLQKIVLELKDVSENVDLSGYEIRVCKKNPNLLKTYGTVGILKLWRNELVKVTSLGCYFFEIVCELQRPIPLAVGTDYKLQIRVGDKVLRWREGMFNVELQKRDDSTVINFKEQRVLAVKNLFFSFYT